MVLFFGVTHQGATHCHTCSSKLHFSLCLVPRTRTNFSLILFYLQTITPTLYMQLLTLNLSSSSNCYPLSGRKYRAPPALLTAWEPSRKTSHIWSFLIRLKVPKAGLVTPDTQAHLGFPYRTPASQKLRCKQDSNDGMH